ncbi:Pr6Pr family membrane protein [Myceligenerans indicum]|uniref:Pr6Pr family membrane protein n=1 Tax=Myceligenerans indicum TaxID=2593663 RepID=A0ABS1LMF5_9MICO|nr:Pr6Pr family membrane protein [Myceligenerans indicum]MBL0886968.1 Pr6Pr family membrane protein [Myceligenerans indicum]
MNRSLVLGLSRLVVGFLGLCAVVADAAVLADRGTLTWYNFFSYFTIESNVLIALVLIGLGAFGRGPQVPRNRVVQALRGAATLYISMTGVIFATLLAGIEGLPLTATPWGNVVLHYLIPVAALIDWLFDPPQVAVTRRTLIVWLLYPLAYTAWALVRGSLDGWYPYPFLDAAARGYAPVLATIVFLGAGVFAAGWLLSVIARRRARLIR